MSNFFPYTSKKGFGIISLILLLVPLSTAQPQFTLLYQKDGAAAQDFLGISVASVGDVNGDGKDDFIVGASAADPGGIMQAGSAYLYSGADGSLLYQKNGSATGDALGLGAAGAGDVNGDGKADFIIGARGADAGGISNAGSAYVYSGADGSLLYQKDGANAGAYLGASVAGAGDVNGDGRDDFIIGAGQAGGTGQAYVYSGDDGSLLFVKNGGGTGQFGIAVAGAGDVNGDGKADFIVGSSLDDPVAESDAGSAWVYSGADGSLLYWKYGAHTGDYLGIAVAGAGDVNGDGKADFIIGAYSTNPGGIGNAGSAYLYSGADGSLLYRKDGAAANDFFGNSVAGAGDVNGDGRADFIIGASLAEPGGLFDAGSAYLYSGADGSLLLQINGAASNDEMGISVAGVGDLNDDGRVEIIIGAWRADPSGLADAGSAYVYSLPCVSAMMADLNQDNSRNLTDVIIMVNHIFKGQLLPGGTKPCAADVNKSGRVNLSDLVILINHLFRSQTLPYESCGC